MDVNSVEEDGNEACEVDEGGTLFNLMLLLLGVALQNKARACSWLSRHASGWEPEFAEFAFPRKLGGCVVTSRGCRKRDD